MNKPNRHKNHILETESSNFFRNLVPNEWFLDKPEHDYGVDYVANISINNQVTGLSFSVQLKSKEKESDKDHALITLKHSTLGLYDTKLDPVLLVVYVREYKEAYWLWYNDLKFDLTKTQRTVQISIPKTNKLSSINWNDVVRYVQNIFSIKTLVDGIKSLEYAEISNSEVLAWKNYYTGNYEEAIFYFKGLLKNEHKDHLTILEGLAHSLYLSYNYKDALQTINKCIEQSGTESQFLIKACILAEDGISTESRARLIEAKKLFREYLLKKPGQELMHYNFANTLSSLGEQQEAVKHYKLCLEINPNNAQAWKNLGSIYFKLNRHAEEIVCYDKALKIDPDLPQALFSKGITVSHIYQKFDAALLLMKKAMKNEVEIMNGFPIGYFWLAYTYEKLGKIEEALYYVTAGLSIEPENRILLDFKSKLLVSNWRKDIDIKREAVSFFEYRLELENHFSSLYHLMNIKEITDEKRILELIKKHTSVIKNSNLKTLGKCGLKVSNLSSFLLQYDKYLELRENYPVNRYISHLISDHYFITAEFFDIIDLIFAKAFSNAVEEYSLSQNIRRTRKVILECLALLPNAIFELIPEENFDHEVAVNIMAHVCLEYPNIAVREFGVQFGFMQGKLGLKKIDSEELLPKEWYDDFVADVVSNVNKKLKLLAV